LLVQASGLNLNIWLAAEKLLLRLSCQQTKAGLPFPKPLVQSARLNQHSSPAPLSLTKEWLGVR